MKKELVTSLLVAVSMGVGVLGTNIYYNNLPKTQVEQQTADKEIEKEKDTVEDKKEIKEETEKTDKESKQVTENKGTKETTKTDKESKQVIKNTETKETAKTNTNNSQSKTEVKETNKSDSNNKTQQSNNSNEVKNNYNIPEYVVCPGCNMEFKKSDLSKKWNGYCLRCYIKYCMPEKTPDDYDEPVGDYWQIDPNNPNRVSNTNSGSGNSSGSGDSFRSTLRIQDFVE